MKGKAKSKLSKVKKHLKEDMRMFTKERKEDAKLLKKIGKKRRK